MSEAKNEGLEVVAWDTAADLPDDFPDAVCEQCSHTYSRECAKSLDGVCYYCKGKLIEDNQ